MASRFAPSAADLDRINSYLDRNVEAETNLAPQRFEVLNDVDNYKSWSAHVKSKLNTQQLWDIVEAGDGLCIAENDEAASEAWAKKNIMALQVIQNSCGTQLSSAIQMITSAKIAWDTLKEICKLPKTSYIVPHEENFEAWSVRTKDFLKAKDLWDIVEATTEPPTPAGDKTAFDTWSKKNAMALYFIWESSELFSLIGNWRTAKIAWDTLAELLKPKRGMENNENSRLRRYESFVNDINQGNMDAVLKFLNSNKDAATEQISYEGRTALHVAIFYRRKNIVEELVQRMPDDKLQIKDNDGITVLGLCAIIGNIKMAECIVRKNKVLLSIENGNERLIPVLMALVYNSDKIEMARFLYSETPREDLKPGNGINGATFITLCIYAKAFDMAFNLLEDYPTLATALDIYGKSPVMALAHTSSAFPSGCSLIFWKSWIYNRIRIPPRAANDIPISIQTSKNGETGQERSIGLDLGIVSKLQKWLGIKQIYELKSLHQQSKQFLHHMCIELEGLSAQELRMGPVPLAIIKAVKKGTVEFVNAILKACPELVYTKETDPERNIFMCAVLHRQNGVIHSVYESLGRNSMLLGDRNGNNILHMAAKFESSARGNTFQGAAIHMQSELRWFKELKSIVHPLLSEARNINGKTPQELFTESHKNLVKKGEDWMKEKASSCTMIGTLIVTIMFAAAITVPGGTDQTTGLPMFLNKTAFTVFIVSDALSLISSSISVLVFLGLITSRYAEEDFLISLPTKMIIGLSTLIFSIATMMITFCATLFIILNGNLWIVIPAICLAGVPVALFAAMQFQLLDEMWKSTYGKAGILDGKVKS